MLVIGLVVALSLICLSQINQRLLAQPVNVPVFVVNPQEYPNIAEHTKYAQETKGKPSILTRLKDEKRSDDNRDEACKDFPKENRQEINCDEYPPASTYEGGAGASTWPVPAQENKSHGSKLGGFYRQYQLEDGDKFKIVVSETQSSENQDPIRTPKYGSCECPYDLDRAGNFCGKRSSYYQAGGYRPACYIGEQILY